MVIAFAASPVKIWNQLKGEKKKGTRKFKNKIKVAYHTFVNLM